MLEFVVFKRRRNFCWQVRDQNGKMVVADREGREPVRPPVITPIARCSLLLSTGWKATNLRRTNRGPGSVRQCLRAVAANSPGKIPVNLLVSIRPRGRTAFRSCLARDDDPL